MFGYLLWRSHNSVLSLNTFVVDNKVFASADFFFFVNHMFEAFDNADEAWSMAG